MSVLLNNQLREMRGRQNITQAELAQMVGVSRKTINTVENAVFVPSTVLALKIAKAFNCAVEDVFSLGDMEPPDFIKK